MVVGEVNHHNVEIVLANNRFKVTCNCGLKKSYDTRRTAFAYAHLHVAEAQTGQ